MPTALDEENLTAYTTALRDASTIGDASAKRSFVASEVLFFYLLDTDQKFMLSILLNYAVDKPILLGLLTTLKQKQKEGNMDKSALIPIVNQLAKIESTVYQYELFGKPLPTNTGF